MTGCCGARSDAPRLSLPSVRAGVTPLWAQPLVSVVVPYYNAEAYLNETVASLAAQTLRDFEVVVVDDGSSTTSKRALGAAWTNSDATAGIPDAAMPGAAAPLPFPVRFVCHVENRGLSAARNSGAAASRGVLIVFLDPDDTLEPMALEKMVLLAAYTRSFPGASAHFRNGAARADRKSLCCLCPRRAPASAPA